MILGSLRWLTTVFFPRLSNERYDCLPDISISRACKNDASNIKKCIPPEPVGSGDKELAEFANQLVVRLRSSRLGVVRILVQSFLKTSFAFHCFVGQKNN